jgi:hypothetical protein
VRNNVYRKIHLADGIFNYRSLHFKNKFALVPRRPS